MYVLSLLSFSFFILLPFFKPLIVDKYWKDPANVRAFFEKFARDNNFDPLVASSWYKVHPDDIIKTKVLIIISTNNIIQLE